MKTLRTLALFPLVLLSLAAALPAAEKPLKGGDKKHPPAVTDLKKDPPKTDGKSADYSQENIVVEKLVRSYRFENDGSGASSVTARIRVQTQGGVQQMGQIVWGYNSANEKLVVDYLRVSQPDGSGMVSATDANYQDVPSQIEREAPSYTDYRERHITVPALRPGQVLEYKISTITETPLVPGQFWFEHVFRKDVITLDEELILDVPAGRSYTLKNKDGFKPAITDESGRRILKWTNNYLKRETDEELKKKRKKEARVEWSPDIQLTTFKNWEEVGAWYASLQKSQMELSPALKAKVAELTKDKLTDEARIQAIYDFVAQDYRYVSLSFGTGRFQPHAASEVYANRYGDCKDKHTLFSSMLREAGYSVQPVLAGSRRKLDPDVPSPAQFDHVFSAILPKGGKTGDQPLFWADTTTEVAPFGLLTPNVRKKDVLLVGLDGPSRLIETPANPPFPIYQHFTVEGGVSELGKLTATVKGELRGDSELALRSVFRSVPEAKWKDVGEYLAAQLGIGGEVSEVKVDRLTDTHQPLILTMQVSRPNYFDWSNKKSGLAVALPAVGMAPAGADIDDDGLDTGSKADDADDDDNDAANVADGKKRDVKQIVLGSPNDVELRMSLTLPPDFKARIPVPIKISRDYAVYQSSYQADGNKVNAVRTFHLAQREIAPDRRSDYKAFIRAVRSDEAQKFFVENTNMANSGAPALPKDIKTEELLESGRDAFQSQNFAVALEMFKLAAEKEPKNKIVWNMLGETHMAMRHFDEADAAFRKQLSVDPFDQFANMGLGRALYLERRLDDAVAAFQKQLEVNPLDKDAYGALGEIFLEQKKYQDAADVMAKAVSLDPENGTTHANLGRAYLYLNKDKEALDSFDKAVELRPDPMLWNNIAYELAQADKDLDRAQQYAESAVSSVASSLRNISLDRITLRDAGNVSSLGSFWDTLGWVHFKRGDLSKAERYIQAAWVLTQNGEVGQHLGQIREKEGKKEDAIHYYALALNGNQPKDESRELLSKLVPDKAQLEKIIAEVKPQLEKQRTFDLGSAPKSLPPIEAKADFFVLLAPGNKVESVRFINGNDALKPMVAQVQALNFGEAFPDSSPAKLIRRGTVTCAKGGCSLQLVDAEDVISVDR